MDAHTLSEIIENAFFSGGLTNRLFCKIGISRLRIVDFAERILITVGVAWLPLVVLSAMQGAAWGARINVPFLSATDTSTRFLVALPLLIFAEKIIGRGMVTFVNYLETSRIVRADNRAELHKIVEQAGKLLQSMMPECVLMVLVLSTAVITPDIQMKFSPGVTYWGQNPVTNSISFAGFWYKLVSHPVYRFLVIRWLWRYGIWVYLLFNVSRLRLTLTATHPDLAGGLGFLGITQMRFAVLAFALSAQMSGYIARRMIFEDITLQSYKYLILGLIVMIVIFFLAPLFIFSPQLIASKRNGFISYGILAEKYTDLFEKKWIAQDADRTENLLGTQDIQSLADFGESYALVRRMTPYPFTIKIVLSSLVLASAVPFLPLLLLVYKVDVILAELITLIF